MIKVLIVDDQTLLRRSLAQIINTSQQINVVATVGDGHEAIEACAKYKPDIVLMDIEMPKLDGISALEMIKQQFSKIKVIILTTFDNRDNITAALLADTNGYITKDIDPQALIATILCVNHGLRVMHDNATRIIRKKLKLTKSGSNAQLNKLSITELQIITFVVQGCSNKQIATELNFTEGTIKNKISRLYDKLGIADRLQLVVFAMENGIE